MSDAPALPYSLTSTNPRNSFDFLDVLDPDEIQLLSISLSMASLSSLDSDSSVPPFPDKSEVQTNTDLMYNRIMGREKKWSDDNMMYTTIATPPKTKNMPVVTRSIDSWVTTFTARTRPPGHVPWAPPPIVKIHRWVASGSLYPPEDFKCALQLFRRAKQSSPPLGTFGSVKPRANTRCPESARQGDEFRKTLVFEREIPLGGQGETKHLSVQVPASTMNPEMVDIMLELQDLNSFFKESLVGLDESVAILTKQKEEFEPSFSARTSEAPKPKQLETPVTLAARRGKASLPPLSLPENTIEESYPSIPTAFLGTPSAYSPKFEHSYVQNVPSMKLKDMIADLRSRCNFAQNLNDIEPNGRRAGSPLSATSFAAPSDQASLDGDDWAFAVSFLNEHQHIRPGKQTFQNENEPYENSRSSNALRVQSFAFGPPPSPVPNSPLPASPVCSVTPSNTSSHREVRGILKNSKNVRFASLPQRPDDESDKRDTGLLSPPPTTASSILTPPEHPSRASYYTKPSRQITETPQQKLQPLGGATSNYSPSGDLFEEKSEYLKSGRRSPRARNSIAAPARRSTPPSIGKSFSRFSKIDLENEASPRTKTGLRWTMNDMSLKRRNSGTPSEGTPKSRMPVPLRNILTRFK